MTITKELLAGYGVWLVDGEGFYASYKADAITGVPYLTRLKYIDGTTQFPADPQEAVIISDVATIQAYTGIDITSTPERECELFIRSLYVIGISLDSVGSVFDLHDEMEVNGKLSQYPPGINFYNSIAVFDFMAMTGAILYPFNRLAPGAIRPLVSQAEKGDNTIMLNVIRKLGIWGYIANILSEYGMSIAEFSDILAEWKPLQQDRQAYVYGYLNGFLRTRGYKLLSESEIAQMIA